MRRKTWKILLSLVLALLLPVLSVSAKGDAYHWYIKRTGNEMGPELPKEMAFIRDHAGVYRNENVPEDDKVIYLTFDAGYENGNVEKILDVLDSHGAEGAFFVLQHLVTANTDLVMRMVNEGHLVCNHTAHHKDMSKISDFDAFRSELVCMEEIFRNATGREMAPFYRPPEGAFNEDNLKYAEEMGYVTVFWSLAYADWDNAKQPDPEKATELLLKNTHNGMILLLHPTSGTNAMILDSLLSRWEEMGYRFGSLEELTAK